MNKLLVFLVLSFYLCACTTSQSEVRPDTYFLNDGFSNRQGHDLFANQGDMSDQDIEKILNYRLQLPDLNRIAIISLSNNPYSRHYSQTGDQLDSEIANGFIEILKQSDRVYDASYLPTLLVPEKRTFPFLRAAAARYQADLLLLIRNQCDSFEKYRVFKADETRAYCALEAVLLDIRTGIIPFTGVANESFVAKKIADNMTFSETIQKAEFDAYSKALNKLAINLNNFLAKTD